MDKDIKTKFDRFNREFKVIDTKLTQLPRDLSKADRPKGDCQDYGKSIKKILGLKWYQAIMIRTWSPQNFKKFPYLPRHAVLWVFGEGFIDSSRRKFTNSPFPNVPIWPVGFPLVAFILYSIAVYQGWISPWGWF